jgi:hypothetical protein
MRRATKYNLLNLSCSVSQLQILHTLAVVVHHCKGSLFFDCLLLLANFLFTLFLIALLLLLITICVFKVSFIEVVLVLLLESVSIVSLDQRYHVNNSQILRQLRNLPKHYVLLPTRNCKLKLL